VTAIPGLQEWVRLAVPAQGRVLWITPDSGGTVRCGPARAAPEALPVADRSVDGVVLDRVLPRAARTDRVFAEVRRVLRPAGSLVVVVPAPGRSWRELRRGARRTDLLDGWACRAAVEHPGWLLAAADFALLGDTRALFPVPEPRPADLVAETAWPHADVRVPRPGGPLPVGFRRLVARR
jgi:SAM-dependent methyltransferase